MPFAVLPLASSFKISVSRSDKVNSVETSWQIASISVGLTGALVNSKMLVSRFVKGIMRKASKQTKANATGSVAIWASSGFISNPRAIPLPTKMPKRADTTESVKATAGEKNPRCIKMPKYIISDTSIKEDIHNAPMKLKI